MRAFRTILVLVLAACAFTSLAGCAKKTEDEKIRMILEAVRKAAEDRDVKGVLSHVDKSYRDPQGNDYQGVRSILLYYYFRNQKISIVITNIETVVEGPSAKVRFQAILAGGSGASGGILPEGLSAYRFDVSFRKDQNDWKILSAVWQHWGETSPDTGPR